MKRPLVAVALCYGAGAILGHFLEAPLLGTFIVSFALVFAAFSAAALRPLILPSILFLFGWLNISTRTSVVSPHDLRFLIQDGTKTLNLRAQLTETPSLRMAMRGELETFHTLAEIDVTEVQFQNGEWQPAFGRMMSRTSGILDSNSYAGQSVEINGVALKPLPPVAAGMFDYQRYLRLRGIHYEFKVKSAKDWRIFNSTGSPPIDVRFRTWAQRTLARGLPEQDQSLRLQWAMLLGWQTALTSEVSEPFMHSGTMHIFAISGLHIALIAGISLVLLRALTVPRVWCGIMVIPAIWFYAAVTGWQASAIRSTVMMTIIILGWSLKRPTDLVNSLAAAAFLILLGQPEQLFQASFQLSFFVVLSIALLLPPIEKLSERLFQLDPLLPYELRPSWQRAAIRGSRIVWRAFATSLAAFIGSMPLIAYYFHLFTPGSLLANLVVVPVSSLALMSGMGALITGDIFPLLTECFNNSGWLWMRLMIWLSSETANLPGAWFYVSGPGPLLFTLYYGVLLSACAGWFANRVLRALVLGVSLLVCVVWLVGWREEHSWHHITACPLSGGHAVYIEPRRGNEWLVDCGSESAFEFTMKPFLQAKGVNRLPNFFLTCGSARQIGGAVPLNEQFSVGNAFASPVPSRSSIYREVLSALEVKSTLRRCATNGFAPFPWAILHPDGSDRFASADDSAVVALGIFDGVRVLLVSDLGKPGQSVLAARHPELSADIIIAGLPSAGEPLASEWLSILRPKLIVVADSELPASRRAGSDLRERLQRNGAKVLFTRDSGAVTIAIRDGRWRINVARSATLIE